jgi:iduronate 2-sulfatase
MNTLLTTFILLASITLNCQAQRPNVLLICVDDLRPELASFGVEHIHSPNIDRLASAGRAFHRHYVNAPTCGASRYSMLTGRYGPTGNMAIFDRAKQMANDLEAIPASMPEWFRQHGYTTVAVGKVSHHPGGWGGEDWSDHQIVEMPNAWDRSLMPCGDWKTPRGAMHGLAHGEIRLGRPTSEKPMSALQSSPGEDTIYNDGLIADEGIDQLTNLAASDKPFLLAIGLIKPHLPFGSPQRYMQPYENVTLPPIPHAKKPDRRTTWHKSGEFFGQYSHDDKDPRTDQGYADKVRRHYAACVTYADKHVGDILNALKKTGRDKNTIVVLWGDHGWHLGEHGIWGKHCLFEEALRSPLIIHTPDMPHAGEQSDAVVETVDIFPTLCELTGMPQPTGASGVSLKPQLTDPNALGHEAYSYTGKAVTIRNSSHRMVLHTDGFIELYDHGSEEKETKNVAKQYPHLCDRLKQSIANKQAAHQKN